jgi:hypothetical protein
MAASALTFLQIVNRVLERLRESSVAAYNSTEYSTLIAGLVNQVKAELEERFPWQAMRDTWSVTATPGNASYALTDAGMNAEIMSAWNTTTGLKLTQASNAEFDKLFFGLGSGQTPQTGDVTKYCRAGLDANYDIKVDVHPVPVSTNVLKFQVYKPQDDLAADATVPLCPQNVLIEETIARAMAERGDDGAQQPQMPGEKFIRTDLLAAAIAREAGNDPDETDWQVE